ncbi:hypothetical protein PR048_017926 [Dryococelus australis]|uniref:Uncharacterized protein n=1 Tax=Dryococelus australis TaxID=614101 RepID=A0ABQ9HAW8_9NEOP|nr:hypothetical protein PR048_017926 [Dryococelus australis]
MTPFCFQVMPFCWPVTPFCWRVELEFAKRVVYAIRDMSTISIGLRVPTYHLPILLVRLTPDVTTISELSLLTSCWRVNWRADCYPVTVTCHVQHGFRLSIRVEAAMIEFKEGLGTSFKLAAWVCRRTLRRAPAENSNKGGAIDNTACQFSALRVEATREFKRMSQSPLALLRFQWSDRSPPSKAVNRVRFPLVGGFSRRSPVFPCPYIPALLHTHLLAEFVAGGKREIPKETRRPTASSGTIPTCENPVTRPGIESGSPWWETSAIITQPPRPLWISLGSLTFTPHRYSRPIIRYEGPRWCRGQTTRLPPRRTGFAPQRGSLPDFRTWESCRTMPLVGGFFSGLSRLRLPCVTASLYTHITSPSSAIKTSLRSNTGDNNTSAQRPITLTRKVLHLRVELSAVTLSCTNVIQIIPGLLTKNTRNGVRQPAIDKHTCWPASQPTRDLSQRAVTTQTEDSFPEYQKKPPRQFAPVYFLQSVQVSEDGEAGLTSRRRKRSAHTAGRAISCLANITWRVRTAVSEYWKLDVCGTVHILPGRSVVAKLQTNAHCAYKCISSRAFKNSRFTVNGTLASRFSERLAALQPAVVTRMTGEQYARRHRSSGAEQTPFDV